jgi:hypothetical protein
VSTEVCLSFVYCLNWPSAETHRCISSATERNTTGVPTAALTVTRYLNAITLHIAVYFGIQLCRCGSGSSVGIATGYGLEVQGSNPGGGEILRTCPDRPWGPPSLLYNRYRAFPEGRKRPGRDTDPHPFLVPRSKTE